MNMLHEGYASLVPCKIDLTDYELMDKLQDWENRRNTKHQQNEMYLIAAKRRAIFASNLEGAEGLDSKQSSVLSAATSCESVGGSMMKHFPRSGLHGNHSGHQTFGWYHADNGRMSKDVRDFHPDVVILIDYPGFNLKMAKFVKTQLHIPVHCHISPKIWAWNTIPDPCLP